ncbi:MAG: outer membrane protein assembly factor BamD [Prevotellaceae bacterium]|jgi:outer membrane protein assembly factor BamD|nr:outer membrane protein assembly factor BamD [Prevotellaceae bacterium]
MKKIRIISVLFVAIVTLSSCSKYEKLLKKSDNETKYKLGMECYNKGKYRYAAKFFEPVLLYLRGTERDDSVNFYYAKAYYLSGDPYTAEYYFDMFKRTFPRSAFAEEATFLYAACLYSQSHRPELDQVPTIKCITAINEYLYTFPTGNQEYRKKSEEVLKELQQRLVNKSFMAAKLYFKIEDYRSAIKSFKNHLQDYPDSNHREEALFLILKSSYLYATHSKYDKRRERYQSAIDEYLNFTSEFPVSEYKKEVENMYATAVKATQFGSKSLENSNKDIQTNN